MIKWIHMNRLEQSDIMLIVMVFFLMKKKRKRKTDQYYAKCSGRNNCCLVYGSWNNNQKRNRYKMPFMRKAKIIYTKPNWVRVVNKRQSRLRGTENMGEEKERNLPFKSKYISWSPDKLSEITTRPTEPISPPKSMESPSHSTSAYTLRKQQTLG